MNNLRQSRAWICAVLFPSALVLTLLCHPVYCAGAGSDVQTLLDLHGNQGGFIVYVGEGQNDTLLQLGKHSSYRVHGLLRNDEMVVRTRQRLSDAGLYGGNRVQKWDGGDLPYIANLVSLLICENAELVSRDEALRVLSPGGLALFRDATQWKQLQKPLNPDTDQWPQHFYDAQNNPVCKDSKRIWELDTPITPLGVAADASCVYVCDWEKILCVDRLTGSMKWASKKLGIPSRYQGGLGPRLVVKDDVVLFANSENVFNRKGWAGPPDPLVALSADSGEQLWAAEHPASGFHSPEDLFVIDGTVWFGATMDGNGKGTFTGLDLKTGALKSSFDPDDNSSYWWHQRCYPQKATEKYILTSRTGIEYVDPLTKHWELNHWVRGACTFGVVPANGLTYAPQHPCACYPESKLSGMNALAANQRYSLNPPPETPRLEKGPAYNDVLSSNGKHIFMSSQVVTMDGERLMTDVGARHNVDEHSHIFSPTGLLDDSWWHRSYVAYGNGVSGGAGWGSTLKAVIGGKIMCADKENIYSFGRKSKYNRWTLHDYLGWKGGVL